jgi:hypothetical protein
MQSQKEIKPFQAFLNRTNDLGALRDDTETTRASPTAR